MNKSVIAKSLNTASLCIKVFWDDTTQHLMAQPSIVAMVLEHSTVAAASLMTHTCRNITNELVRSRSISILHDVGNTTAVVPKHKIVAAMSQYSTLSLRVLQSFKSCNHLGALYTCNEAGAKSLGLASRLYAQCNITHSTTALSQHTCNSTQAQQKHVGTAELTAASEHKMPAVSATIWS